jgi:hypothetical protein
VTTDLPFLQLPKPEAQRASVINIHEEVRDRTKQILVALEELGARGRQLEDRLRLRTTSLRRSRRSYDFIPFPYIANPDPCDECLNKCARRRRRSTPDFPKFTPKFGLSGAGLGVAVDLLDYAFRVNSYGKATAIEGIKRYWAEKEANETRRSG